MGFTLHQLVIFAARGKNIELLKERIAGGGDPNYLDAKHGSALMAAINNDDEVMVQYLIDSGANVNLEDGRGVVPLEVALHHASDGMVRRLACSGAKISSRCRPHWKERLEACLRDY